jgi:hypothetical protein
MEVKMVNTFRVIGNDPQKIIGLYGPEDRWCIQVGNGVDKIEAYIEDGNIPWFAIYRKGRIDQRVNSLFVESVIYA